MENASKALIIAGAILVSIMIIGLGVVILNNVRSTITNQNLHSEEAQANNEKFTSVFNQNMAASEVKNLINQIRVNNITAENDRDGLGKIYILVKQAGGTVTEMSATNASKAIKNGKRYEVNTPNDKSIKETQFLADNAYDTAGTNGKDAAYYYNGFIRAIEIVEISGTASPT